MHFHSLVEVGILTFLLALTSVIAHAQDAMKPLHATTLLPDVGQAHHPVTTSSPEARQFFNQGLTLGSGKRRV